MIFLGYTTSNVYGNFIDVKIPSLDNLETKAFVASPLSIREGEQQQNVKLNTKVMLVSTLSHTDSWICFGSYSLLKDPIYKSYIENRDQVGLLSKDILFARNSNDDRSDKPIIITRSEQQKHFTKKLIVDALDINTLAKTIKTKTDSIDIDVKTLDVKADRIKISSNVIQSDTKKFIVNSDTIKLKGKGGELVDLVYQLAEQVKALAGATSAHHTGAVVVQVKTIGIAAKIKSLIG